MHLQDWETRLRPYLPNIELLGEISLNQVEFNELKIAIGDFVKRRGLAEATHCLRDDYPAVFVTYLAFEAALNDERSFWDKVSHALGLETSQPLFHSNHHWGKNFREILTLFPNLRQFKGVSGLEYVTPIRLHGGIPAHSLPDFFRHILSPSLEKAPFDGMEDEPALKVLLQRSVAEFFVDDIVRHFFKHGGEPALKFFGKCRHLARLWRENRLLPSPQELGLRPYVLQAFDSFQNLSLEPSSRRRKPRLYFDPYQPAFRVVFPPQPFTLEQAGQGSFRARLYSLPDNKPFAEQRVRIRRNGLEWASDEIEWLVDEPLSAIQISLFAFDSETPVVSYPLRLLPGEGHPPLLAFSYSDSTPKPLTPALPAQTIWLFYPADAKLQFDGNAREKYTMHPFSHPWENWQAQAWDLKNTRLVRLLRSGQDICAPLLVSVPLEPTLEGNLLHSNSMAVDEKSLYGLPPRLRLPLRDLVHPELDLAAWSVKLESRDTALPTGTWEGVATDLTYRILPDESCALVELTSWLGQTPVGTYHVTIGGKGQPLRELPFRVCPNLTIENLQPYYLPDKQGARPIAFNIRSPENYRLLWDGESQGELTRMHNGYQVRLDKTAIKANIHAEILVQSKKAHLPLCLAIPRLRWALLLKTGKSLEWHYQPIHIPLAQLLQFGLHHSHPRLRIELAIFGDEKPLVALHLNAPGYSKPLLSSDSNNLVSDWLDFDLVTFVEEMRKNQAESVFEISLELLDAQRNLNTSLPVLQCSQSLDISECRFEPRSTTSWTLHWKELHPLRHRRLRLWSLWQPWADPMEIPLPDDALKSNVIPESGWWMCEIPDEFGLPPSAYRAHFVAVSPYDNLPLPLFPPEDALSVEILAPTKRLEQIDRELMEQKQELAFAFHVEKLCIYQTLGQKNAMQEEIKWCLSHWGTSNLLYLDALQRWLVKYDPNTRQAFLLHMFSEGSLKKLTGHSKDFIHKYLSNLPAARSINSATSHTILEMAQEPQVILYALKTLMRSEGVESQRIFWQALENRRFSESDAAQMLAKHLPFARQLLPDAPSHLRTRLLRELSRHCDLPEFIVKTGYYVLFDGGWGEILEIDNLQSPNSNRFYTEDEKPIMTVNLLHLPNEKVRLDITKGQITLMDRNGVYRCGCGRFIAFSGKENEVFWQQHLEFCKQASNRSAKPAQFTISQPLFYTAEKPSNPFNTIPPREA